MSAAAKKAPFHLVFGSDEYAVARAARKLVDELCPPADQAFGLESLDGAVELVDEIGTVLARCLEAVRTVGFFGAGKVVWLRDAGFFGDLQRLGSEAVKPRLAELVEEIRKGLLPGFHLVISTPRMDRRSAFFKAAQELAQRHEFSLPDKPKEADAAADEFCAAELEQRGLRGRAEAMRAILHRTGADRRQIANEVEKLDLYLGKRREFTAEDVQAIVSRTRELPFWDLADAFGRRDLSASLAILRQLVYQKEQPMGLLISLENRIRELLVFRDLLQRRWMVRSRYNIEWRVPAESEPVMEALGNDPRKLHPFRAGKLAEQAEAFSLDELRELHRQMLDTHEKMVSVPVAPELLLELFLVRALAGAPAAGRA